MLNAFEVCYNLDGIVLINFNCCVILIQSALLNPQGFQRDLGSRKGSVRSVNKSAKELMDKSSEDTSHLKSKLQELDSKWDNVCQLSGVMQERLDGAMKEVRVTPFFFFFLSSAALMIEDKCTARHTEPLLFAISVYWGLLCVLIVFITTHGIYSFMSKLKDEAMVKCHALKYEICSFIAPCNGFKR